MPWNKEIEQAITLLKACQAHRSDSQPCPARGDEPGATGTCPEKIVPLIILLNALSDVLPQHDELYRIGVILEQKGTIPKLAPNESYSEKALDFLRSHVDAATATSPA